LGAPLKELLAARIRKGRNLEYYNNKEGFENRITKSVSELNIERKEGDA